MNLATMSSSTTTSEPTASKPTTSETTEATAAIAAETPTTQPAIPTKFPDLWYDHTGNAFNGKVPPIEEWGKVLVGKRLLKRGEERGEDVSPIRLCYCYCRTPVSLEYLKAVSELPIYFAGYCCEL